MHINLVYVRCFHPVADGSRPKPFRYATWKSNGVICVCTFAEKHFAFHSGTGAGWLRNACTPCLAVLALAHYVASRVVASGSGVV